MLHSSIQFNDGVIDIFQMPDSTVNVPEVTYGDMINDYSMLSYNERHAEMERLRSLKEDIDMSICALQEVIDEQSSVINDMIAHPSGQAGMGNSDVYFRL